MSIAEYKELVRRGRALEREAAKASDKATAASKRLWAAQAGSAEAKAALAEQRQYEKQAADARTKAYGLFERAERLKEKLRSGSNPKRKNTTIIRAKKIEHLDVSKVHSLGANPRKRLPRRPNITSAFDLEYIGDAATAEQGGIKGWKLSRRFFPRESGHKTTSPTKTTLLDLTTGSVWKKRRKNPKRRNSLLHTTHLTECKVNKLTGAQVCKTLNGKRSKKRRNVQQGFYDGNGVFHPIRASVDYSGGTAGETGSKPKHTRSKKRAAAAKKASHTARERAASKQRKATTSRLAGRSLQRSVPLKPLKKTRRNPRNPNAEAQAKEQFKEFHGYAPDKTINVYIPESAPVQGLSVLGEFHLFGLKGGREVTPAVKTQLLRDLKGRLHLGTSKPGVMTHEPAGSIAEIRRIEYIAAKPHLGEPNKIIWFHKAGEEGGRLPELWSDGKGGLVIKGGDYYITPEGIRN